MSQRGHGEPPLCGGSPVEESGVSQSLGGEPKRLGGLAWFPLGATANPEGAANDATFSRQGTTAGEDAAFQEGDLRDTSGDAFRTFCLQHSCFLQKATVVDLPQSENHQGVQPS